MVWRWTCHSTVTTRLLRRVLQIFKCRYCNFRSPSAHATCALELRWWVFLLKQSTTGGLPHSAAQRGTLSSRSPGSFSRWVNIRTFTSRASAICSHESGITSEPRAPSSGGYSVTLHTLHGHLSRADWTKAVPSAAVFWTGESLWLSQHASRTGESAVTARSTTEP